MHLAYPYTFSQIGRTEDVPSEAHVRDLIEQVLFTAPGERVMRPDFGCGLVQLVFTPNAIELASATEMLVQSGLQRWLGDLIVVKGIGVTPNDAQLTITVEYSLRRSEDLRVESFSIPMGASL